QSTVSAPAIRNPPGQAGQERRSGGRAAGAAGRARCRRGAAGRVGARGVAKRGESAARASAPGRGGVGCEERRGGTASTAASLPRAVTAAARIWERIPHDVATPTVRGLIC
ncbi:F-box/kelch-repeat protein, partial [Frankliniella fusca]